MTNLSNLIIFLDNQLHANDALDQKLGLGLKLRGIAGEAIALTKLFSIYGQQTRYIWYGKLKKDYDLIVQQNSENIKVQIKTSCDEKFMFRVLNVPFEQPLEVIKRLRSGFLGDVFQAIDDEIDKKDVSYWLLVHLKKDGNSFYKLDKLEMKQVLKKQYKDYYRKEHREKYNFAISSKTGTFMPILKETVKSDLELLSKYRI